MGVAIARDGKTLFVADTYNHKLKKVDVAKNFVTSLQVPNGDVTDGTSLTFKEPGGLCVSTDNKKLYVADTNNHIIKILHIDDEVNVKKVQKVDLRTLDSKDSKKTTNYKIYERKPIVMSNNGGKLILKVNIVFRNGLGLTEEAPQSWVIDLPSSTWSAVPKSGNNLSNIESVITIPSSTDLVDGYVSFIFDIVTCTSETCLPLSFIARVPVKYDKTSGTHADDHLEIAINPNNVVIS